MGEYVDWYELEDELYMMPNTQEKGEALVNAIRKADEAGIAEHQLMLRYLYVCFVIFHDDAAKAVTIATEYADIFERNSREMEQSESKVAAYMMTMQMGIDAIVRLPQIPMHQWEQMMEGYLTLIKRYHIGMETYWKQKYLFYRFIDLDKAFEYFRKFMMEESDILSDCSACDCAETVRIHLMMGDRETADRYANDLMEGKYDEDSCDDAEKKVWLAYLEDALRRNSLEEAAKLADMLYPYGNREKSKLETLGVVLYCYAYTNQELALKIVEERFDWAAQIFTPLDRYVFYKGAWVVFREAAKKQETVTLSMSENFPLWNAGSVYQTKELEQWFFQQAKKLGERFDSRNGSDYFARDMESVR